MNVIENKIVQLLTGKPSLHDVTVDELKAITNEQPYFTVVQLLLTQKMKREQHEGFAKQLHKTALYFPNPHWLHYQLAKDDLAQEAANKAFLASDEIEKEITAEASFDNEIPVEINEPELEGITGENATIDLPVQSDKISKTTFIDNHSTEAKKVEVITSEESPLADSSLSTIEPLEADVHLPKQEIKNSFDEFAETKPVEVVQHAKGNGIFKKETAESVTANEIDEEELPLDEEEMANQATLLPGDSHTKVSELMEEQAAEFKKPVETDAKLPIKIEPYHTVDYFASQGIKLEARTQDSLDNKVRRFTDWLKQMKRINPQPADLGVNTEQEHQVQDNAESSNQTKDIVTEAMAEVLIKQGKTEKARQVFEKLSFLNPSKSAYFASRIKELKGI